ncbi:MAG TPA: hypothetical protein PKC49_02595 [Phycisphaerae bacterium]|nr:hypothetical protein [Phycisphaerae bacterium]
MSRTDAHEILSSRVADWLLPIALLVLAVAGLAVLALVGYCAIERLSYPYELEWMEGLLVDHATRAAQGRPIYVAPSGEFIPLLYTPLHYYVAAWLTAAGLDGFRAGRWAGLIGLLGATAVATRLTSHCTQRPLVALTVPPLVAAAYFACDGYYDAGRSDGLLALCVAVCVAAMMLRNEWAALALYVAAATASVFVKQSVVVFHVLFLLSLLALRTRLVLIAGAAWAALTGGLALWLNQQTGGWFFFYAWETPAAIGMTFETVWRTVSDDLLGGFAPHTVILLLATAAWLMTARRASDAASGPRGRYGVLLFGTLSGLVTCAAGRAVEGGAQNVFIPLAVLGAAFMPAALARAADALPGAVRRAVGWRLVLLLLALIIVRGIRDPRPFVPDAAARETWRQFQDTLARLGPPERLWVLNHGCALGRGRSNGPHTIVLVNYLATQRRAGVLPIPDDLRQRIESRYFAAVVVREFEPAAERLLSPHYAPSSAHGPFELPLFGGARVGPERIWLPAGQRR